MSGKKKKKKSDDGNGRSRSTTVTKTTKTDRGTTVTVYKSRPEQAWDSGLKTISSCGFVDTREVYITPDVLSQIDWLLGEMKRKEWFAFLIGELDEGDDYVVWNLVIPEQEVTGSSVDLPSEIRDPDQCVGVIHAHPGTHFSGSDERTLNDNYPLSIVVDYGTGKMKCSIRDKVPCNNLCKIEVEPKTYRPMVSDEFIQDVEDNINEKTFNYNNQSHFGSARNGLGSEFNSDDYNTDTCKKCNVVLSADPFSYCWKRDFHFTCQREDKDWFTDCLSCKRGNCESKRHQDFINRVMVMDRGMIPKELER